MPSATPAASLETDVAPILALVDRPVTSAAELAANLRQIYNLVLNFDLNRYGAKGVNPVAHRLMQLAFDARMRLRDQIGGWSSQGFLNTEALAALRDVFRISRYGIDMLGESRISNAKLPSGRKTRRAFTGTDYNTFVHRAYASGKNVPFRSGDVLLVRGTAHNSAAIARIGDVDTQFSHVAFIYIDPQGRHLVLEALIEDGAVINTLEHALDHGLARAVLYRHKDPELAARAAELMHARLLATKTGKAAHIPYDFTMRLKGTKRMFCSKLVRAAYEEASGGKVLLPAFRTRLDMKNRDFFRRIGVRAAETFAPGDIDVDPSFDLVAEWQDYRITSSLRFQDLMMDKFFQWMERDGYRFRETLLIRLIAIFGRLASYLSNGAKELLSDVVPRIPSNMKRSAIAAVAMLHKSGEEVLESLKALEEDHVRMTGLPLPPAEAIRHLEVLREVSGGRIGYLEGRA